MDTTPRKRVKILTLAQNCSKTQSEIADLCGVSQSVVSKLLKRYRDNASISPRRRGKCGRKRKTTARDDQILLRESKKDARKSSTDLKHDLMHHGVNVSTSTVRRRLIASGRRAHRPVKKQLLTAQMMRRRLQWARKYRNWTKEQWAKVIFSDECHFEVQGRRTQFVRRSVGEPIRSCHIDQRVKHPVKQMFWGCFTFDGPQTLQPITGMMNSARYIDVLNRKLIPLIAE